MADIIHKVRVDVLMLPSGLKHKQKNTFPKTPMNIKYQNYKAKWRLCSLVHFRIDANN